MYSILNLQVQLNDNFSFSDISFHVLAPCSEHAFDTWADLYQYANQNVFCESQLKYTLIRKCHHSTHSSICRSVYFHDRFAITGLHYAMMTVKSYRNTKEEEFLSNFHYIDLVWGQCLRNVEDWILHVVFIKSDVTHILIKRRFGNTLLLHDQIEV